MNDFYDGVVAETMGLMGGLMLIFLMLITWVIQIASQQNQFVSLGQPIGDVNPRVNPRKERASSVGRAFRSRLSEDFGGTPWV